MKKLFFLLTITCICVAASAQNKTKVPRYVSDMGFWVVEDNIHTPNQCTVYFYNNNQELVYQQKVSGGKLNLAKRKVLMALKGALETSVVAWEQKKTLPDADADPLFVINTRKSRNQ